MELYQTAWVIAMGVALAKMDLKETDVNYVYHIILDYNAKVSIFKIK